MSGNWWWPQGRWTMGKRLTALLGLYTFWQDQAGGPMLLQRFSPPGRAAMHELKQDLSFFALTHPWEMALRSEVKGVLGLCVGLNVFVLFSWWRWDRDRWHMNKYPFLGMEVGSNFSWPKSVTTWLYKKTSSCPGSYSYSQARLALDAPWTHLEGKWR